MLAGELQVPIKRDEHGVPHVYAQTEADLYRGIGNCHGVDRGMQMLLTRILGARTRVGDPRRQRRHAALDRFFRR
jgi:penicillin amidase